MTPEQERKYRNTHESFTCPAGHSQYFSGQTEQEKKIEQLERRAKDWRKNWQREYERAEDLRLALRTCPLCGVILRAPSSVERHLRTPVADGGHGAGDVELEAAEAIAAEHRRSWPKELVR
jgi:hypothetical protein